MSSVFNFYGGKFASQCQNGLISDEGLNPVNNQLKVGMNPVRMVCSRPGKGPSNSYHQVQTVITRYAHGRMMQHGGCNRRMEFTVHVLDRLDKLQIFNRTNVIVYFSIESFLFLSTVLNFKHIHKRSSTIFTGAHFSYVNPIILHRRLVEFRDKLDQLYSRNNSIQIVFKLPNFWKGAFTTHRNVVISYYGKRISDMIKHILRNHTERSVF